MATVEQPRFASYEEAVAQHRWFGGLALLFSGRWPNGMPPAWSSGEAVPWPTQQELREQRERERQRDGEGSPPASESAREREPAAVTTAGSTHSASKKRKRKRRR